MPWYPFREIDALRREIDSVLAGYEARRGDVRRGAFLPGRSARAYPLMNLSEDGDNVYVQALAPGIDPAGLDINVHRSVLTVAGEKPGLGDIPAEAYHRCERAAGRFIRTIDLPAEINADGVEARYSEGVLTIKLPKAEIAKPRQIPVTTG